MHNGYFVYNGIESNDLGISLQSDPVFGTATPNFETEIIVGRNGDQKYYDGSYSNVSCTISCYTLAKNAAIIQGHLNAALYNDLGYHRLFVSSDPECYRMATLINAPSFDVRRGLLAPFMLEFECKPQRFLINGERPITITSATTLRNAYMDTKPLIKAFGTSAGTVTVGDTDVAINTLTDYILIDCELETALRDGESVNNRIHAETFPTLKHGENAISFTGGITKLEITPRWWTL